MQFLLDVAFVFLFKLHERLLHCGFFFCIFHSSPTAVIFDGKDDYNIAILLMHFLIMSTMSTILNKFFHTHREKKINSRLSF